MAWFQNLADKAEDFLNKIDQNAATVLNEPNNVPKPIDQRLLEMESNVIEPQTPSPDLRNETPTSVVISNNGTRASSPKTPQPSDDFELFIPPSPETSTTASEEDTCRIVDYSAHSEPITYSSKNSSFNLIEEQMTYEEHITRLEMENTNTNQHLLNLQHLYSELKNDYSNLKLEYERASSSAEEAYTQMEQYKARAQRILHEKEALINVRDNKSDDSQTQFQILTTYNEELKKELQFQHERNNELALKITDTNKELTGLQQQYINVQTTSQQTIHNLQQMLSTERQIRLSVEEESKLRTNELLTLKVEFTSQDIKLKNNELEIDALKEKIKNAPRETNEDLELRLQSLTNTLMSKQNTLETLTSEKNALKIQLEKLNSQYNEVLNRKENTVVNIPGMNVTDDAKSQVPRMLQVSPLDAGMTRRMKHAYSTLDMIGIRLGVFLRRYPVARAFLICYMMLLHIWVLFILFTYIPSSR